jgi:hypothetical protein
VAFQCWLGKWRWLLFWLALANRGALVNLFTLVVPLHFRFQLRLLLFFILYFIQPVLDKHLCILLVGTISWILFLFWRCFRLVLIVLHVNISSHVKRSLLGYKHVNLCHPFILNFVQKSIDHISYFLLELRNMYRMMSHQLSLLLDYSLLL